MQSFEKVLLQNLVKIYTVNLFELHSTSHIDVKLPVLNFLIYEDEDNIF